MAVGENVGRLLQQRVPFGVEVLPVGEHALVAETVEGQVVHLDGVVQHDVRLDDLLDGALVDLLRELLVGLLVVVLEQQREVVLDLGELVVVRQHGVVQEVAEPLDVLALQLVLELLVLLPGLSRARAQRKVLLPTRPRSLLVVVLVLVYASCQVVRRRRQVARRRQEQLVQRPVNVRLLRSLTEPLEIVLQLLRTLLFVLLVYQIVEVHFALVFLQEQRSVLNFLTLVYEIVLK